MYIVCSTVFVSFVTSPELNPSCLEGGHEVDHVGGSNLSLDVDWELEADTPQSLDINTGVDYIGAPRSTERQLGIEGIHVKGVEVVGRIGDTSLHDDKLQEIHPLTKKEKKMLLLQMRKMSKNQYEVNRLLLTMECNRMYHFMNYYMYHYDIITYNGM